MNNAKRPNLNEVVSLSPSPYGATASPAPTNQGGLHTSTLNGDSLRKSGAGSQLALAGSMNILSGQSASKANAERIEADEERLKKVMMNMEKDKSL